MRAVLLMICLLTIFSCNNKTTGVQNLQENNEDTGLTVSIDKKIKVGQTLIVEVRNTGNKSITIYSPMSMHFEKKEGESWRKIKIQRCPCGANCLPPPKEKTLSPGEAHTISWDLIESWCGKVQEKSIPETYKETSKPGKYRIRIVYSYLRDDKKNLVKEFNII